jgi:subtilisin family serine protease
MSHVRRAGLAIAAAICLLAMVTGESGDPAPSAEPRQLHLAADGGRRALYVVQIAGEPIASYAGGVAGIPRTKPADGAKLDKRAWSYAAYREYLRTKRASALRSAGVDAGRTVAEYATAFNGFAATLTATEADRLARTTGVVRVWKNEIRHTDTIGTPAFLGLAGDGGVWQREFGDPAHAGEGVIVGVIDTGYWPESPSFAALPEPRPDQATINAKWFADGVDKCDEGQTSPVACNNKVIGARWYDASGLGGFDQEYRSPRDYDGHGSHTASTAAGDYGVTAKINGETVGTASGMAPAARLAVYKALWREASGEGSGGTVDLVQAIDDAVTDGVDVINYSVSGSAQYIVDPVEIAFFNAAAAGVFVAASAGNSGPAASTVAHNAPWTMTVAASSHDRGSMKSVSLGNGRVYAGVGQGPAVPSSPFVDSVSVGVAGADPTEVELCYPGTLDKAKVTGAIVLCKRGVNARTDKSLAVKEAGGVGMVLYNATVNSLNADYHVVPTVHVGLTEGAALKAYLATAGTHTASLSTTARTVARAPEVAAFSSAGPALAAGGDLLKPDITAPGIDIVAAVSPSGHHGNLYDGESGTSMSSPHIAGIAALVRAKHPTWSPTAVKSALMTTAGQTDNNDKPIQRTGVDATPLDYGAGHVQPAAAFDPGLVYESTPEEWIKFGCGIGQFQVVSDWCATVGSIDPSDLNYPSIAVGDLPGKQTVTRTVTNVTNQASVYVAAVRAPGGFAVGVTPRTLVVPAGKSATFQVQIARTKAAFDAWSFGALTLTDLRGHKVRSPIALRPVALSAPAEIAGTGTSGSTTVQIRGGYLGKVDAHGYGLVPSSVSTKKLVGNDAGFDSGKPAASATVAKSTVSVPAGSKVARFATFSADHAAGSDIDLYVYRSGTLVGESAGGTADESITVTQSGDYDVYVVQFALPEGVTEQDVKMHAFVVGPSAGANPSAGADRSAAANLSLSPDSQPISANQTVPLTIAWHDLEAGRRYLGVVEYSDGTAVRARTLVAVTA